MVATLGVRVTFRYQIYHVRDHALLEPTWIQIRSQNYYPGSGFQNPGITPAALDFGFFGSQYENIKAVLSKYVGRSAGVRVLATDHHILL